MGCIVAGMTTHQVCTAQTGRRKGCPAHQRAPGGAGGGRTPVMLLFIHFAMGNRSTQTTRVALELCIWLFVSADAAHLVIICSNF